MSYPKWKRTLDCTGALFGLVLVAPLVPLIAFCIIIETRGPIIVKLERISEGRSIYVYKFRSMIQGAASMKKDLMHLNERNDGPFFKIKYDPRITRTGKVLRKFRIDEFPQLWNVLKGELALVGPRPHEPYEVAQYPKAYAHLPKARAGVTGYSQVNGSSSLTFMQELELDDWYLKNMTVWLDASVLLKTTSILFFDPTAV